MFCTVVVADNGVLRIVWRVNAYVMNLSRGRILDLLFVGMHNVRFVQTLVLICRKIPIIAKVAGVLALLGKSACKDNARRNVCRHRISFVQEHV